MTILTALASNWKWGLYGLIAAALLIGGWQANGWRLKAREADRLAVALSNQIKRERASDQARILLSAQLADMEAQTRVEVSEIIKRVPVYVDRGNCALSIVGVRALNQARGVPRPAG